MGYKISKKSGTYTDKVKVKVKAKKGYTVYYTTGKKLSVGKKIKSNKTRKFTFKKSKTLKLYVTKKNNITAGKLKKIRAAQMFRYRYTIVSASTSDEISSLSAAMPSEAVVPTATATVTTRPDNVPIPTPGESEYTGDDSIAGYIEPVRTDYDDNDLNASTEGATLINMPVTAPAEKITTDTYQISTKNKLKITAPGTYMIQTEAGQSSDGLIEVEYTDDTFTEPVHLILNGINLYSSVNTEPTSDTGLITIKSNVPKAVITIPDGSVSTLTDTGAAGIDKDDGTSTTYTGGIVCKKTPLTINGTGTLNITSTYGNGIKCTNDIRIIDTSINVSGPDDTAAGHNGIVAKWNIGIHNGNISVKSNSDGLKITLDEEDIEADSTLAEQGNMDIDGGDYNIISENGDGISVYRTLYLNPSTINVTAKNASGSSDDGSYKGIKAGTTIHIPDTAGNIIVNTSADDCIHSNKYICIDGGYYELSAGDDAIHSDTGLVINGGNITIKESYEGVESADISINGGVLNICARDGGINAGGGNDGMTAGGPGMPGDWFQKDESATTTNYQIIIRGGDIIIDADGDGIDSNGNIFMYGGNVTVNGPTNSGNGVIDYGDSGNSVCEISGGTLIAAGASGMDAAPTDGSSQPSVNIRFSSTQSASTYVVLMDEDGNTVLSAQPAKSFQSVIMSCEEMKLGATYTIYYGSDLNALTEGDSVTFTSVNMSTGSFQNGGWGRPGRW